MAGVVDRLLAQLPGLSEPPMSAARPRAAGQWTTPVSMARTESVSHSQLIGVWVRVLLGLAVGVMMGAGWPYPRACGMPLAGYLGAVATVILTGAWAASAAWRYRASLAHIVSLIILFYGIVLAAAELLPRTGYSVDRADWQCEETTQSVRISI